MDKHLFVMAHGFGGRKFDLHLMQKVIAMEQPAAHFMHSEANQGKTDGDIKEMGTRLAQEVLLYIQ